MDERKIKEKDYRDFKEWITGHWQSEHIAAKYGVVAKYYWGEDENALLYLRMCEKEDFSWRI